MQKPHIDLSVSIENKQLFMTVKDNGKGFDIANNRGNGLNNMRKRAEDLGGTTKINVSGDGTLVVFSIPV